MKIIVAQNEKEFDQTAAKIVSSQILKKPDSVIGFATGNTTIGFHRELVDYTKQLSLDWSQVRTVNLDEFLGVEEANPLSVYYRMFEQLLNHTNVKRDNIFIPYSHIDSKEQTCKNYVTAIENIGGVDLQVLGIGSNAHIAMNEPNTPWNQDMLITNIAQQTIQDKAHLWGGIDKMPKQGITMGIRLIMQAKQQLLMAKGVEKANAIRDTLKGEITPAVPASALQMHPNLIVLLDESAAGLLWD